MFVQRKMTDSSKQSKQVDLMQRYTLSPEQVKKLIEEKMDRARVYSQSVSRKRETVLQQDYR